MDPESDYEGMDLDSTRTEQSIDLSSMHPQNVRGMGKTEFRGTRYKHRVA